MVAKLRVSTASGWYLAVAGNIGRQGNRRKREREFKKKEK